VIDTQNLVNAGNTTILDVAYAQNKYPELFADD